MTKVFIIEDDENIRELVMYALKTSNFETKGFECGRDFFEDIKSEVPDLILLDIMLPEEDGISILKKIKEHSSLNNSLVIMLTAKSSEYDKVKGLDLGADDYITKPFSVLELLSRIKAVLRTASKTDNIKETKEDILSFNDVELNIKKHTVKVKEKNIVLTYKEFELLKLLLANVGILLSRDKIIEYIWGFDYVGESRTVDMHIKMLRQKLEDKGELIKTVRGIGYKIGE